MWYCRVYLYDNFTLKTKVNLLSSMLSRTQGVMFKVKQLFTKNYLLYALCSPFEVIHSQSLNVPKIYQHYQVTSIKKLLGVLMAFPFIMK